MAPSQPDLGNERPKLQKALAALGLGSRRRIEQWIAAGRVQVNGEAAHLGQRIGAADRITIDGRRPVGRKSDVSRVLVLNKLQGVVCSRRQLEGQRTVFAGLPRLRGGRWIAVGRLDIQTSGLLLLTNDGTLANRLMHPSTGLDREYAVRVDGRLNEAEAHRLKEGLRIEGERHAFTDVRYYNGSGRNHWYHVALMDGRNRAVRKLFEQVGHPVTRLKRVRFGPIALPAFLSRGKFADLNNFDLKELYRLLRLPVTLPPGRARSRPGKSMLLPYPELNLGPNPAIAPGKAGRRPSQSSVGRSPS